MPMFDKPVLLSCEGPQWGRALWTENTLLEALLYAEHERP